MGRTYSLQELRDREISGNHPRGYNYSPYTQRIVCFAADGINIYFPSQFDAIPQDDWQHLAGCLCPECCSLP